MSKNPLSKNFVYKDKPRNELEGLLANMHGENYPVEAKNGLIKEASKLAGKGEGSVSPVEWDTTVSIDFEVQETTATVNGVSFTKTSDKYMTHDQLVGAQFHMNGGSVTLSESDLTDLSQAGVTGTLINVEGFGNIGLVCTEAGDVVSEPGIYLVTQMIDYAPFVTMSYVEHLKSEARAVAVGDVQMEDGVTDLPDGVIYLQIEG